MQCVDIFMIVFFLLPVLNVFRFQLIHHTIRSDHCYFWWEWNHWKHFSVSSCCLDVRHHCQMLLQCPCCCLLNVDPWFEIFVGIMLMPHVFEIGLKASPAPIAKAMHGVGELWSGHLHLLLKVMEILKLVDWIPFKNSHSIYSVMLGQ